MSIHANRPETEAILERQRRRSTVASIVIGVLTLVLIMIVLGLVLLSPLLKETPTIVTYQAAGPKEEQDDTRRVMKRTQARPSAPSSAMARVIAANTASPTAIPVPDIIVEGQSEGFGTGDDFGDGWDGTGGFGGGASFFSQKVQAQRVAYVIDYSASMRGEREKLMRAELKKSVEKLAPGMSYSLIFFAGPVWLAGDTVVQQKGNKTRAVIKHAGKDYKWRTKGGAHGFEPDGRKQEAKWIAVGESARRKSLKQIAETKLVWGTVWEPPLDMALAMEPPPQVIFFMTDGSIGGDEAKSVRSISAKAKNKGVMINTVALMQPKAEGSMKDLAKRTGGQFSIVAKGGKVEVVSFD